MSAYDIIEQMKVRLFAALACLMPLLAVAQPSSPTLRQKTFTELPALSAALSESVLNAHFDVTGTVTHCERLTDCRIVIQTGESAVCFWNHTEPAVFPAHGDVVRLTGVTAEESENTGIPCANVYAIEIIAHGPGLTPKVILADEASFKAHKNRFVAVSGTVTDAIHDETDAEWTFFLLNCSNTLVCAAMHFPGLAPERRNALIGATVRACGISHTPHGIRRAIKSMLILDSPNSIVVTREPPDDPFAANDISNIHFPDLLSSSHRGRHLAVGRVLAVWGTGKVLLRSDSGMIVRLELSSDDLPHPGQRIRATGYPETDVYSIILIHALWKPDETDGVRPKEPINDISARSVIEDTKGRPSYNLGLHGHVVRLRGIVRGNPSDGNPDRCLYLESDGSTVVVDAGTAERGTEGFPIGSLVEVTGVCVMDTDKISLNYLFPRISGYRIVLRETGDVRLLAKPPWWTTARLLGLVGLLSLVIVAVLIWNRMLMLVASRKGRELFRSQISQAESELRIDERTRLAAELHDYIAQNLTAVSYQLTAAESAQRIKSPEASTFLGNATQMLQSCRVELRRCLWDLRNNALDDPDFGNAIRQTLSPVTHGATVAIRFQVPRSHVSDRTAHAILSILRELVANAVRHGKAHQLRIAGDLTDGMLKFSVTDNGTGFDPARCRGQSEGHFGLSGIVERVERLGGTFQIESTPGKGARAIVTVNIGSACHANGSDT